MGTKSDSIRMPVDDFAGLIVKQNRHTKLGLSYMPHPYSMDSSNRKNY